MSDIMQCFEGERRKKEVMVTVMTLMQFALRNK